ncbi:MAG: 50S ribosomal protein L3 N(5)-glutamine methyltransferase [Xanthomonadales bacterium]|nr:50S ribosomal protein L3 N(5)-glutamine methyltransferase [Xanthomonadales bacterium]
MQELRTLGQWIDWAADRFDRNGLHFGHGTDNSHDEAAWLVLHAIGAPLDGSQSEPNQPVDEDAARAIQALVSERIERRCPAAYLTGTAWFAGLEFEVGPEVLVPRSPIAELIVDGFSPWADPDSLRTILDLGTGSGCIAIACAAHIPAAQVTAADISDDALKVARRNVARHRLEARVEVLQSDLFDSLGGRRYDLIVSNPPYVPDSSLHRLPAEFQAEPEVGLRSGMEGLEIPLRIIAGAERHLNEHGLLICEVGESEAALQQALPRVPFLWLEFTSGGSGVFVLEREAMAEAAPAAREWLGRE